MAEPGQPEQNENLVDRLKRIVDNPKAAIEAEMERSPQTTWLSCFLTLITLLTTEIQAGGIIEPVKKTKIEQKIQALMGKLDVINDPNPPDELKQEMITELQTITE